ncbi:MAG: ATP-binding cassette domain-containing protein [Alphaproteobacteria bacterium]|nr:MAG: ATP-binding cassette domain-containing protein [Alphaproteobacteria bacterium]
MSRLFSIRWPEFDIAMRGRQLVVRYEPGMACFDRCLAVVGRSGAGKSLFARALAGLLPSGLFASNEPTSERWLPSGGSLPIAHDDIAYVPQSPASALPSAITCSALLREVIRWSHGDPCSQPGPEDHLERVGLDPATTSNLHASQLSGGMAQRFAICLAVARQPHLLVVDEPTVGLDADAARRMLELIRSLPKDGQMGVILVTHDRRATGIADGHLLVERHGTTVSLKNGESGKLEW